MYEVKLTTSYFPAQDDISIEPMTVGDMLRRAAAERPQANALIDIDEGGGIAGRWSYSELLETGETLALALSTRFKPGARVVLWAPNTPAWIFMEYACALAGLILVTANPSFQVSELTYVLKQSRAVGLFIVKEFRSNPMQEIAAQAVADAPAIRELVDLDDREALFRHGSAAPKLPEVTPADAAQIQYTSGTTGFPKGAVLSHSGLVNNARLFCARKGVDHRSVWANFMPFFHTAGCATGALGCLQAACSMLVIRRFDADVLARLIEELGVTTCFAVPTMLFNLLESLDRTPRDMSSLDVISTGGAPVPPELIRRVRERLGCDLLAAFGQTEHSPMICLNHKGSTDEQLTETAGQPLPQTEVAILNTHNNEIVPVGEVGEICARSYALMIGYNDNPEATAAAIDADGWLHTGDLGEMDGAGFVRVTGRVKDMIIRGGENHFPAEIEAVLIGHPSVVQVAVVGLPDEKWGEIIAAFIISHDALDAENLRAFCRQTLSAQKTPSQWIRVPEFPLTGSGKVQKFVIRDRYLGGNYGEQI